MPLYKLKEEMPHEELVGWYLYFDKYPYGWQDDERAYRIMQAQGVKEKAESIFPSIAKLKASSQAEGFNVSGFKSSKMFGLMSKAVGGDKLDL